MNTKNSLLDAARAMISADATGVYAERIRDVMAEMGVCGD